jgi:D-Tyr-tRNAtyr deacylase
VSTREVYQARLEVAQVEEQFRAQIGIYKERRERTRVRLERALTKQRALQAEYDRLVYTLKAAYGVTIGQQSLVEEPREGPRTTFIVKTSPRQLRERLRELRKMLTEAPD